MTGDRNLFGEELPRLGAPLFSEHWSNRKVAKIAHLAGLGYSAPSIEIELGERGTANTIAHMLNEWGIYANSPLPTYSKIPVPMAAKHRTLLAAEARSRDMSMPELCQRILTQVAVDQLYAAVLEG
jgi:hypothetical protein